MGYTWILFAIQILFTILTGWAKPQVSPEFPEVVVLKGRRLQLSCRDDQGQVRWQREKGRRVEGRLEKDDRSLIIVPSAQDQHMGRYTCVNGATQEESSIYVYVKDPANAFVRSRVNDWMVREGEPWVVPCLVTDPAMVDLSLETCEGVPLPRGLVYTASPQRGILVANLTKDQEGCYVCTGRLGGTAVKSSDYIIEVRLVPDRAPDISLSRRENAILTKGQEFELVCAAANVNYDFSVKWITPDVTTALETRTSHIQPGSRGYQRSATLRIASAIVEDSGVYLCEAQNEKGVTTESIQLDVYERGFINLTEPAESQLQVREGASLTLRAELEAYPTPTTLSWAHQGTELRNTSEHVITIHRHRYRFISELRLVRVHGYEGGIYTFQASHNDDSANHSFSVHVICKPVIVSHEGPVDGQVRCVASGYPAPKISWYYCEPPHTRCSLLNNATEEEEVAMVTVSGTGFGRSVVESRLNVSRGSHRTLECVAMTEGDQAYTLFSISENSVPHQLFTPLLTAVVCAATGLSFILVVLLYKYMQKPKYQIHWKVIESIHGNNYIYIDPTQLPYDQKWEFPRERLRLGKVLGSGAFGKVVQATAYGLRSPDSVTTVAVKMLKPSAHSTERDALMSELKVLSYVGNHVNIVNLLGACTQGGPTLVITEYCCYGDLLSFLRRKKEEFFSLKTGDGYYKNLLSQPEPMPLRDGNANGYMPMRSYQRKPNLSECGGDKDDLSLDTEDLLSFSYQVAKGMDFLTSKNCIHRDLAARNILLTKGRVAKICDFGLARDIASDSNYVLRGNARLPVKWMSPESLFEGIYTFESDVWSYGILLWEIFSLGNSPYPGIHVGVDFYRMIQDGFRMSEPEFAPSEIYEVMRCCWSTDPLKRPSFKKLVERTEVLLSEHTKREYLNLLGSTVSNGGVAPPESQRAPSQRLSSVSSTTAPTQPLLSSSDVFLEYDAV
ncbi:KIT proto-oncogene, receptor tyrosine kinase b [Sardina pilchardus]|uniref:KIT proto-oncogene, receptor tyrosine kinase b n=1 Tax=Sardina pilchardus TaxID=27697 RepID=UPI002E0DE393